MELVTNCIKSVHDLRYTLFLPLQNMCRKCGRKKDVPERWEIVEGTYLPKEVSLEKLSQFRQIPFLKVDSQIFGIIGKQIIEFVRKNQYKDGSTQKAGIPSCIDYAYSIWEKIRNTKEMKSDISVTRPFLANTYVQCHMPRSRKQWNFWFPEELIKMMMKYYSRFQIRFTAG